MPVSHFIHKLLGHVHSCLFFINSCDIAFEAFLITEGVAASRLKLLCAALQPPARQEKLEDKTFQSFLAPFV